MTTASSAGAVRGLLRELRSWARYLLPGRYVAVYYPTPVHVARTMLQLAEVSNRDTVYDIGCGDGRILILAAQQFGAAGFGIELDPELAKAAADAVRDKGLQDRVRIVHGDATGLDVADATVLTVYLSESGNKKLLDGLCNLQPGVRVVSLYFPVRGWGPQLVKVGRSHNIEIFLYKVQQQQQP